MQTQIIVGKTLNQLVTGSSPVRVTESPRSWIGVIFVSSGDFSPAAADF